MAFLETLKKFTVPLTGETVTGELSKLLDEIKLCQEKDYSFEDLCHTISDHYLDNLSKISEEELGKNGSQSVVSNGGDGQEDNSSVFTSAVCTEEAWALCTILSADSASVKCQATYYFSPRVRWCFILTACGGEGMLR